MKRSIYSACSIILAMLISGSLFAEPTAQPGRYKAEVEVLHGISVTPDAVSIDVRSSGCTRESSFKWIVRKNRKSGQASVAVIRIVPDLCKAIEQNVTLTYKRSEIGLAGVDSFSVRNQFRGFPRF